MGCSHTPVNFPLVHRLLIRRHCQIGALPMLLTMLVLAFVKTQVVLSLKLPPLPAQPRWFYNGTHASPMCETTFRCDTSSRSETVPSCSCHANCSLFDACCEDVRPSDWRQRTLPPDAYECAVYPQIGIGANADRTWDNAYVHSASFVFLITKCPSVYAGSCISRLCELPKADASGDRIHLTWVTDRRTGLTYKNKFCAICHGLPEENMEFWSLSYSCIPDFSVERFGLTGCIHHVSTTKAIVSNLPRCFGPYFPRCPNGSTQQLQEACESSPTRFFFDLENYVTYRNYNCSLCYSMNKRVVSGCTTYWMSSTIPPTIDVVLVSGSRGCLRERATCDSEDERSIVRKFCTTVEFEANGPGEATVAATTASAEAQRGDSNPKRIFFVTSGAQLQHKALLIILVLMLALARLYIGRL